MLYNSHKEIPLKYRRIILDETLQKRIAKVPLKVCNEIIENHLEEERENESLKHYEIEWMNSEGHQGIIQIEGRQNTLVELDRILDYGENTDLSIKIVVRQAKKPIAVYAQCQWLEIPPKDKLVVKSRSAA